MRRRKNLLFGTSQTWQSGRGFKGGHWRGTSQVVQWLRLPEQEARLQSLVRELDPIGAATKTQYNQIKKKEMDTWGCHVLQVTGINAESCF